jgi:hypothetical protein
MNALLILASFFVGTTYSAEDFHYYDEGLQAKGVLVINKVYVGVPNAKDRKEFVKFAGELKDLERFKEIEADELNGIILFFKNKIATINGLNKCLAKGHMASPVAVYEGIECTALDGIIINMQPSVNKDDYIERLNMVADGDFKIVKEEVSKTGEKYYVLVVKNLKVPSNILILANLIAKDAFWTKSAKVVWVPLDGYVKATASVVTPATSHLGQGRNLKVVVEVFDSEVKVRTDLIPQLGQGLVPFPNVGELWFDSAPPQITESQQNSRKTITITYPFRQIYFGSFAFQPIVISYERNGKLLTTNTNTCEYNIRSVIEGTHIEDIQPRGSDGLNLSITKLDLPVMSDTDLYFYKYLKSFIAVLLGLGGALLASYCFSKCQSWLMWMFQEDESDKLWSDLKECRHLHCLTGQWRESYLTISNRLNKVLVGVFGVSLYSISVEECNDNFKKIIAELNKLYESNEWAEGLDVCGLTSNLVTFCKQREYK